MISLSRRAAVGLLGAAALPLPAMADDPEGGGDTGFVALSAAWLVIAAQFSPVWATQIGDHRFDADLDDMSEIGRVRLTQIRRKVVTEVIGTQTAGLTRAHRIDAAILSNHLRHELWSAEVLRNWSWDPLIYNERAGSALYSLMARDFAPLPARLASATARMEKLPGLLAQARASLVVERVPAIHAETVARQNKGMLSLISELITPHAGALTGAARTRLDAATAALIAAVNQHQAWIEKTLVPGAKGEFRLGADLYDTKLAFALQSSLGRAEIRGRAEAAVITTRKEMYALAKAMLAGRPGAPAAPDAPDPGQQQAVIKAALDLAAADHPARGEVVEAAETGLADATAFVRRKDLITLPTSPVQVILVPEFQRGVAVAYCDAPGPMDKGLTTFYAISPVPDDWTAQRAESFLREYNRRALHDVATHEAMPGHYVQLAHANAYPSMTRSVLSSGSFVEGWAVYAESMMAQEGFLGGDPLYKLVVLKTKLRSIVNAILDQAIHVDGMTREAAMTLMTETAFQEESEAAGKWIRACVSSAQLSFYFVGSEEHWDIRRKAERTWGKDFALKRYHDTVLSFGSPPARFVRASMFDEPIG
ncbi:MAG TPA: DUF885 domain-containing protein [Caulobacteraceae bacterium]|nr:DUF885 domain-containing protein [Caulobacteraceae bacterium]